MWFRIKNSYKNTRYSSLRKLWRTGGNRVARTEPRAMCMQHAINSAARQPLHVQMQRQVQAHRFTRIYVLVAHVFSLFLSLCVSRCRNFFPPSESKFPIATLSKISRCDRSVKCCYDTTAAIKCCSAHGDQLKFYFILNNSYYLRLISCFTLQ